MFKKVERILVVGLGNPGTQYEKTRHNVGFNAIEQLLPHLEGAKTKNKFDGELIMGELFGKEVILLRPQTFMNNSGQCVGAVARFYKIKPQDVYVIFDDVSLNPGQLRIRPKGSPGGHNGIKSLIVHLGTDAFMHVKVGVGAKPHPDYDLADWVLANPSGEDKEKIDGVLEKMPALFRSFFSESLDRTMNKFNLR
jgi:PTH1 family peptidyl-tRNA hydrolase